MRERITWFLAGAVVAGSVVALLAPRTVSDTASLEKLAQAQAELVRQQALLDRRFAAFEQRMAFQSAVTSGPAPMAATSSVAVPPTAEQQRAAEAGSGVVQRAIAAGTWTRQDTADLHAAGDMGGEALMELRRQIAVAINEDRLKVEPGTEFRW
jgi:hypothetical protein